MSTRFVSPNGDDATAKPDSTEFPWKTLAGVMDATNPGDAIKLMQGNFRIEKATYGLMCKPNIRFEGSGKESLVENFSLYGIQPGDDSVFDNFAIDNMEKDFNAQFCFSAVIQSFRRTIIRNTFARGDSDIFQAGGQAACTGVLYKNDWESKADLLIISCRSAEPSLFTAEDNRFAAIGPSVYFHGTFPAQTISVTQSGQLICKRCQIITTHTGVIASQTPKSYVLLQDSTITDPNGNEPPEPVLVKSEGSAVTFMMRFSQPA